MQKPDAISIGALIGKRAIWVEWESGQLAAHQSQERMLSGNNNLLREYHDVGITFVYVVTMSPIQTDLNRALNRNWDHTGYHAAH
ncbi:MAG: hypothetical protein QGG02_04405 [Gammaproteobacteria bacterium]|jgi:hypothetical protein|nr:hypothetical protein [Gammaproteobacteria bacterium]|tara:strand:- start:186 stop:440 length:255 start_codon:yes stop_codon:yes gene_type:complete